MGLLFEEQKQYIVSNYFIEVRILDAEHVTYKRRVRIGSKRDMICLIEDLRFKGIDMPRLCAELDRIT